MTITRRAGSPRGRFIEELFGMIAQEAAQDRDRPRRSILVVGDIGAGKTAAGLELAQRLRAAGIAAGGILAPRIVERGETVGYNILDVSTGEDAAFARPDPPGEAVGRFFIRPAGRAFAERALRNGIDRADVVLVDEIGRWELNGGGHAATLRALLTSRAVPVVFVRSELVQAVIERFGLRSAHVARLVEDRRLDPALGRRSFWGIVDSVPYPLLVTLAADGFPQSRPMTLAAHDERTLWFPTSRSSRKVAQIGAHAALTVLFVDSDRYNYASFHGLGSLDADRERARRLWRDEWKDDWPRGAEDPDYALLRVDGVRGFYLHGTTGETGEIDLHGT